MSFLKPIFLGGFVFFSNLGENGGESVGKLKYFLPIFFILLTNHITTFSSTSLLHLQQYFMSIL